MPSSKKGIFGDCSIINDNTNNMLNFKQNMNASCRKIVIFDFDGTLTRFNIPAELSKIKSTNHINLIDGCLKFLINNMGLDKIFSELVVDKSFLELIQKMKNEHIRIMIMSYGYKDIIKKLLTIKGYLDIFELIITPADFGLMEGYNQTDKLDGKNVMLDRVSKVYGVDRNNMILIDDSYENVSRACNKGYKILHVDGGNGLTLPMLKAISNFVKK